jgi:hypothetical protein
MVAICGLLFRKRFRTYLTFAGGCQVASARKGKGGSMRHEAWLALHILGVVLFLGNIVVTAVWKVLADRTRNPAVVAYAQRLVTVTDIAFTATGVT